MLSFCFDSGDCCMQEFQLCFFRFRPVCGIRGKTLIINLPGSKKGSQVRNVLTDLLGRNMMSTSPCFEW